MRESKTVTAAPAGIGDVVTPPIREIESYGVCEGIAIVDIDTLLPIDCDDRAPAMFGYSRAEFLRTPISIFRFGECHEDVRRQLRGLLEQGGGRVRGTRRKKNGEPIRVEILTRPDGIAGREVLHAVFRDVTDEMRLREGILAGDYHLALAQRVARLGSWEWDVARNSLSWSDQLFELFGLAKDRFAATRQAFLACVHAEDRPMVESAVHEALLEGRQYSIDYRIVRPDGEALWVQEHGEVFFEGARPVRIIGTVQDVNERKESDLERQRLEVRLHYARKLEALGLLVGGIAHDFKNLLGSLMNYAYVARKHAHDEACRSSLDAISDVGLQARDLVMRLLSVRGEEEAVAVVVDLRDVVKEVVDVLRMEIVDSIDLEIDLESRGAYVKSSPAEMRQVVSNLAKNALDAMRGPGGTLRITVGVEAARAGAGKGRVTLVVADTGPGIEASLRERVFDPFFSTKPNTDGIGMGLAIVKGIVRDRGGSIDLESESEPGSRFTVTFPLAESSTRGGAVEEASPETQERE